MNLLYNTDDALQVFEPEPGMLHHADDFDSYEDHVSEAERDYLEVRGEFYAMDAGFRNIMQEAERVEKAGKTLITAALGLFRLYPGTQENKKRALEILDHVAKDMSKLTKTCGQYYRFMKEANPTAKELLARLFDEKQKHMRFLFRCAATHSKYLTDWEKEPGYISPEIEEEIKGAIKAERERSFLPEGSWFCPPMPFPPERIPEGEEVPDIPDPFQCFVEMDPAEKDFDVEHQSFVPKKGYVSADGLIDEDSIVFDWENKLVTMKYRGGVPVTWPFEQYRDLRAVPKKGEWFPEYFIRLCAKTDEQIKPGVLKHDTPPLKDVPAYNIVPGTGRPKED